MLIFSIAYCLASAATFAILFWLGTGFPFFPRDVYRSNTENCDFWLGKGHYYILFFVEGRKDLAVNRGDVGSIQIFPDGKKENIVLSPSNFFFDEAPGEYGIRGHSVGQFDIHWKKELNIKTNFRAYGYDGLLIRTGFGQMIKAIVIFEAFVISCSLFFTCLWLKRKG